MNDGLLKNHKNKKNLISAYEKLNEELKKENQKPISKEMFKNLLKDLNIQNPSELDLKDVREALVSKINEYLKEDEYYHAYSGLFFFEIQKFCSKCIKSLQLGLKEIFSKIKEIINDIIYEEEKSGVELDPLKDLSHPSKLKLIGINDMKGRNNKMVKKVVKDEPVRYGSNAQNQVVRTSNRNEVANSETAQEKLRQVLAKLADIASAVGEAFNLDERLVFEDFVKDLRILNNPRAIAELDPSNPIDMMTRELLSHYIGNEADFNIFGNQAVNQIMSLTNEQAVERLGALLGRAQLGTTARTINNRLGGRSQRALPRVRDSKADEERFAQKFGIKALARFKKLAQRLQGHYNDITWVTAHIDTPEDLNEILNNTEFYGYDPIAENEDWVVFDVDNLEMCEKLARGTNWCITSPTAWNTNARFGARYNFYINKNTGEKYCVAMVRDLKEIVDGSDNELAKLPTGVPAVGGGEITSSVVQENTSSSEALVQSALRNVDLLPTETLRNAYSDLFGEELEMLDDNEIKDWIKEQIQGMDSNELKRYIENHIDDFAVTPQINNDFDEVGDDDYEDDDFDDDDDYEDEDDEDFVEDSKPVKDTTENLDEKDILNKLNIDYANMVIGEDSNVTFALDCSSLDNVTIEGLCNDLGIEISASRFDRDNLILELEDALSNKLPSAISEIQDECIYMTLNYNDDTDLLNYLTIDEAGLSIIDFEENVENQYYEVTASVNVPVSLNDEEARRYLKDCGVPEGILPYVVVSESDFDAEVIGSYYDSNDEF